MEDRFGTAAIRARVLRAWTESPARLREDANTEEDHALGGYRDRVIVELAQNAADAALRAGVPGRLRVSLRGDVLTAANTGASLTAAGVAALCTLRASDKRGEAGAAGRFGVGFAAVAGVTDEPSIASAETGGVRWSAPLTRDLVAAVPELAGELAARDGHVPVLRLPFPLDAGPVRELFEDGFATVVRLPLRDAAAVARMRAELERVGPALLLALPGLTAIELDVDGERRALACDHRSDDPDAGDDGFRVGTSLIGPIEFGGTLGDSPGPVTRWLTVRTSGGLSPELLADRPVEERSRPHWRLRWACPLTPAAGGGLPDDVPAVVHAPTRSDEPLGLGALLIATFPLAPDRRHVAPGPLTDFLIERAAEAYGRLLCALPENPRLLELVPGPVAEGALDARLRRAIRALLPALDLLPAVESAVDQASSGRRHRGDRLVALDAPAPLLELLAAAEPEPVLPRLLAANWPPRHQALDVLGVRRLQPADLVDALAGLDRPPGWWRRLYDALAGVDPGELGALPVPLADGRTVRGPRGLLISAGGLDPAGCAELGLRVVHPDAAHPLLGRLGAIEAAPRDVLADPAVRAAVAGSYDADDPGPVADAVLGLVAAATPAPGDEPWLADLALPGSDGDVRPAGELLLPGSPLRDLMAADAPFEVVADELVDRHGAAVLAAVGVLDGFAVVHEHDVEVGQIEFDLDDEDAWVDEVLDRLPDSQSGTGLPSVLPELIAVRDLELVADWPAALRLLARPPLREAVVRPVHVVTAGVRAEAPSYTAWWLSTRPVLDGRAPRDLRLPGAGDLAGLYDEAPAGLDEEMLRALGVRESLAGLLAEPAGAAELLHRLADPSRQISRDRLRELWTAIADLDAETPGLWRPELIRALVDGEPEIVPAEDAIVVDLPCALSLLAGQPLILVPYDRARSLAEVLGLALAGDEVAGVVESPGVRRPVPAVAGRVLPEVPEEYVAHAPLIVDGEAVSWWYDDDGVVHAGDEAGLARGLAWAADHWTGRLLLESVLRDPAALPGLLAERDLNLS